MRARFDQLRAMGIRTIMVTGDNQLTAAKIAEEAGVDDFLAEATPERKLELIREQQADGRLIAMTGDGTNDAPALAQADVGVAMNTGTQAAREAGNMVDLDSNPTKLIEIVEVGKQLLITRGALTTFSIANDVAKYFAILPAMFAATYAVARREHGPLDALNVMSLGTPESAILSAVIFNALVIPLLIPLSLRGVRYRPIGATGAAAPQHAGLRPRRPDRPLHRDQADRPRRPQPAGGLIGRRAMPAAAATRSSSGWRRGSARPTGCCRRGRPRRRRARRRDRLPGAAQARGDQRPGAGAGGGAAAARSRTARSSVEEMDLPALLARAPELALIDELAHTNPPGLEHGKRYEDIADVLAAGIDVFSTVNVQHLESLNDQVAELTGVRVRETVPDSVLGDADEVVLVDLTPEALVGRLRAGKIYPGETRRRRPQQLLPDREPGGAARGEPAPGRRGRRGQAARLPRASARHPRGAARRRRPKAVGERLLALVRPQPSAQRLVRRAWRSAQRLGTDLDLLWVKPPGKPIEGEASAR